MDNNGSNQNFNLNEIIKGIHEMVEPITKTLQHFQEIIQPITETIARFESPLKGFLTELSEAMKPLRAAEKLGNNQYIYWNYMTTDFIETILATDDINKTLYELITKNHFKNVNETIEKCKNNSFLHKHIRLFNQSIIAFQNNQNDLAVIGFTSIVDGLLTDVSGNHTTKIATRASTIIDKLNQNENVDSNEYALLILIVTFQKTITSFSANSDFSKKEPKNLNRHWIMHGRSRRKKTKLDCIKLINIIYGILLITKFSEKEVSDIDTLFENSTSS